jgi:signal peptidase
MLALLGGPWAAVVYRGVIEAAEWLSPALPALTWSQTALASAVAGAVVVSVLRPASTANESEAVTTRGLPGWAIAGAFVIVGVIWLNSGLLGVRPAIVSGISMEPTLRQGDIVFTRSVALESLGPGDVIRFDEGGVPVLHRILEVRQTAAGLSFITQGDNNPYPDAPVAAASVEGEVVLTIPKLGLAPIAIREWLGR